MMTSSSVYVLFIDDGGYLASVAKLAPSDGGQQNQARSIGAPSFASSRVINMFRHCSLLDDLNRFKDQRIRDSDNGVIRSELPSAQKRPSFYSDWK
jgi:hypothetical protein